MKHFSGFVLLGVSSPSALQSIIGCVGRSILVLNSVSRYQNLTLALYGVQTVWSIQGLRELLLKSDAIETSYTVFELFFLQGQPCKEVCKQYGYTSCTTSVSQSNVVRKSKIRACACMLMLVSDGLLLFQSLAEFRTGVSYVQWPRYLKVLEDLCKWIVPQI